MIVEPWDDEFDCSQLVHMRDIKVIESLSCNGTNGTNRIENNTNGTTDTYSDTPSTSNSGVFTPVVVELGALILAALVCLIVFYRRKARALMAVTQGGGPPPRTTAKAGEPDCAALDGNQIMEANSTCLPHQMGGADADAEAEAEAECVSGGRAVSPRQERITTTAELA
ncbi:hypothetical protein PG984_005247 [Apiospora sp. TS-2023a]